MHSRLSMYVQSMGGDVHNINYEFGEANCMSRFVIAP